MRTKTQHRMHRYKTDSGRQCQILSAMRAAPVASAPKFNARCRQSYEHPFGRRPDHGGSISVHKGPIIGTTRDGETRARRHDEMAPSSGSRRLRGTGTLTAVGEEKESDGKEYFQFAGIVRRLPKANQVSRARMALESARIQEQGMRKSNTDQRPP